MPDETTELDRCRIKLSVRQTNAFEALARPEVREVLYGGAKGGGKSWLGCLWAYSHCLDLIERYKIGERRYPLPVGFMGRKQSVDFTATTLQTWLKVIPESGYELRRGDKELVIEGRVKIAYGGMDDQAAINKFNSAEYAFFFVDQAEEISIDEIGLLRGTLRLKIDDKDVPTKGLLTANPAQCWLKGSFIDRPEEGQRFIQALPSDNPFLHTNYIEQLKTSFKHRPELLEAYLYGNWDALEAGNQLIKTHWIETAYTRTFDYQHSRILLTCDPARFGDDETVTYRMDNTDIIEEEIYGQKDLMFTANNLHMLALRHPRAQAVVIDSVGLGSGVADRLREMSDGAYMVIDFNGAAKSRRPAEYGNLRAESYDRAAQMFSESDISLTHDERTLRNQLVSVCYEYKRGRLMIEPKDEIKKRLNASPDRADAYIMGLWALDFIPQEPANKKRRSHYSRSGYHQPQGTGAMAS